MIPFLPENVGTDNGSNSSIRCSPLIKLHCPHLLSSPQKTTKLEAQSVSTLDGMSCFMHTSSQICPTKLAVESYKFLPKSAFLTIFVT